MPVYEYICSQCSEEFSYLKLKREEAEPSCPVCGSLEVVKKLSAFSFGAYPQQGSAFRGGG